MKIIADQNIPFVKEAFSSLGEVHTYNGAEITRAVVKDATFLLVRSVTRVDKTLLEGSSIKFVASATIGKDHIDESYLEEASIGFTTAPGSNANSVAEYVLSAMATVSDEPLEGKTLAIVGVGNIGSLLYEKAKIIGMKTTLNDPPKASEYHTFLPLKEALVAADFVSIHVPLTYDGHWPTHGLVNETFLSYMKDGAVLINASRGKTLVEEPLLIHADRLHDYVLDVWPKEPTISQKLLDCCAIATPHIAGYSFDGKCRGTELIYEAANSFFFKQPIWKKADVYHEIERPVLDFKELGSIESIFRVAYDISADSDRLFDMLQDVSIKNKEEHFARQRKEYPRRLEFKHYEIKNCDDELVVKKLKKLGFFLGE